MHDFVWEVIEAAWKEPFRIESNFAREKRWAVAFASSVGWISVITPDGLSYNRTWHVTAEGLFALRSKRQ